MTINSSETAQPEALMMEKIEWPSDSLQRTVRIDLYQPASGFANEYAELLLINDGQDLLKMPFKRMVESVEARYKLVPLLIAGIHCGEDRVHEYGMSVGPDYKGWGSKAAAYEQFVVEELLPFIRSRFHNVELKRVSFAGFSLGGLSALDIAWNNPEVFSQAGVFSASLWWRDMDKDDKRYQPWINRMMHRQIAEGEFRPGMRFFFECGENDEFEDRNRNGVIDSIDDTIDIMRILIRKGYREGRDLYYLQMPDGRHDVESWAKALPAFLEWGFRET